MHPSQIVGKSPDARKRTRADSVVYLDDVKCRALANSAHEVLGIRRERSGRHAFDLGIRQPEHLDNAHTAGERLGNLLHEVKRLRTCQPHRPHAVGGVYQLFDVRQELRGLLNLVDKDRGTIALQEQRRILFGRLENRCVVERHVCTLHTVFCILIHKVLEHGRLAHLTRAGYNNDFEVLGAPANERLKSATDIHSLPHFFSNPESIPDLRRL